MPSEDNLEKLVRILIRKTTEGDVEWKAAYPPRSRTKGTDDIIEDYFETTYKGQKIAVFERRFQGFNPEAESLYWTSAYVLAFVDGQSMTWETEEAPLMAILFKAAKDSAADVDGILKSLLD